MAMKSILRVIFAGFIYSLQTALVAALSFVFTQLCVGFIYALVFNSQRIDELLTESSIVIYMSSIVFIVCVPACLLSYLITKFVGRFRSLSNKTASLLTNLIAAFLSLSIGLFISNTFLSLINLVIFIAAVLTSFIGIKIYKKTEEKLQRIEREFPST